MNNISRFRDIVDDLNGESFRFYLTDNVKPTTRIV